MSRDDRPKSAAYLAEETGADLTLLGTNLDLAYPPLFSLVLT